MSRASDVCAREVLDTVPLVMGAIRATMRSHRVADLSVPQFRALAFLNRHPGASLGDIADHIGLTLSAISRLVDDLVERGLVLREPSPTDRRYITLALTPEGRHILETMRQATQVDLMARLDGLSEDEQATIVAAMGALRRVFSTLDVVQTSEVNNADSRN